jgi:hypothetical protein
VQCAACTTSVTVFVTVAITESRFAKAAAQHLPERVNQPDIAGAKNVWVATPPRNVVVVLKATLPMANFDVIVADIMRTPFATGLPFASIAMTVNVTVVAIDPVTSAVAAYAPVFEANGNQLPSNVAARATDN